jgi:Beta protein
MSLMYMPLLRGDATNLTAISHLSAPSVAQPVLVVDGNDLRQIGSRLGKASVSGYTLAIDVRTPDRSAVLRDLSRLMRPLTAAGIGIRPVIQIDDEPDVLRSIGTLCNPENGGHGVVLRVRILGRGATETARQATIIASTATRIPRTAIHILLDEADAPSAGPASDLIPLVASQGPWGSITVAAGAAPAISSIARRGEWQRFERREADVQHAALSLNTTSRVIGFGDYGNRHATLEAHAPHARGNGLRWLHNDAWYVCREAAINGWPPPEVRQVELSDLLGLDAINVAQPRSWGERELVRFMAGDIEPDLINAWMVNHHLESIGQAVAAETLSVVASAPAEMPTPAN